MAFPTIILIATGLSGLEAYVYEPQQDGMEPFRASRNASSFKTPDGRQGVEKRAGSLGRLLIMITVIAESLTFHAALALTDPI